MAAPYGGGERLLFGSAAKDRTTSFASVRCGRWRCYILAALLNVPDGATATSLRELPILHYRRTVVLYILLQLFAARRYMSSPAVRQLVGIMATSAITALALQ